MDVRTGEERGDVWVEEVAVLDSWEEADGGGG